QVGWGGGPRCDRREEPQGRVTRGDSVSGGEGEGCLRPGEDYPQPGLRVRVWKALARRAEGCSLRETRESDRGREDTQEEVRLTNLLAWAPEVRRRRGRMAHLVRRFAPEPSPFSRDFFIFSQ